MENRFLLKSTMNTSAVTSESDFSLYLDIRRISILIFLNELLNFDDVTRQNSHELDQDKIMPLQS